MSWDNLPDAPKGIDWSKQVSDLDTLRIIGIMEKVIKSKRITPHKPPQFRMSKLPICGLLHAIEALEQEEFVTEFSTEFFTGQGNAIHDTLQSFMPLTKEVKDYVFGDWECTNIKCDYYNSSDRDQKKEPKKLVYERCTTPKLLRCPHCKTNYSLKYSELELNYKGISGHVDMILFMDDVYWLIDFKTTSEKNVLDPKFLPYPKHRMQIEAYIVALREQYGIKISLCFLDYRSRNTTDLNKGFRPKKNFHPVKIEVTKKSIARRQEQLDNTAEQHRAVNRLFKNPTKKNLKALDALRPCHSLKDYENKYTGMEHGFFANESCPYLVKGSCFKEDVILTNPAKKIWRLLTEDEDNESSS